MSEKHPNIDAAATAENEKEQQGERPGLGRYALFFLPAILGLIADLGTKSYMFANYFEPDRADPNSVERGPQFAHWWVDEVFGIQTSTNPGALFGMGAGYSWLFAIFSLLAICGIVVWLFGFRGIYDRWLTLALGLVTGGIFGNLYDRVGLGFTEGFPESIRTDVRDWILFRLEGVPFFDPWPNFNIADSVLVIGATMLFLHALFLQPNEADQNDISENSL